jgi:hypothetical protein
MVNARILFVFELILPQNEPKLSTACTCMLIPIRGVKGVIGFKKLIGFAALAAAAIVWGSAAEASPLSFNLQSADYNYSWTMDSDPNPANSVVGSETIITDFTGQAMGSSGALPTGALYFYASSFFGGFGFTDQASGQSLFDFIGDQIYSNGETAPSFATGTFFMTFDNKTNSNYSATLTVAAVAATPIPAALPLFVSALGGLGFVGWRRKRATSAAL